MDNKKVVVRETLHIGKGLYAIENIAKGEIIADWTGGKVYEANTCTDLPKEVSDHAIQFGEHLWIDTEGIGRFTNHSCEPNCGSKGEFQLVAMRAIRAGEWLTWDYEMNEDSDWRMNCKCGSKNCRKIIGAFKNMPEAVRKRYEGYVADWIVNKYHLPTGRGGFGRTKH